jgi:hypothetical protein
MDENIISTKKIYDKNKNIFKFPYSICSLTNNNDNEKKILYDLYDDFLNLEINEQIKILMIIKKI